MKILKFNQNSLKLKAKRTINSKMIRTHINLKLI